MKRLACGWWGVRYLCVTKLDVSCSEIWAHHWLTNFSGVQTKYMTYVHILQIFMPVFFAYAMFHALGCNLRLFCCEWVLFSTTKARSLCSYCFNCAHKQTVLYWSTAIQYVWKHRPVILMSLSLVCLLSDRQFKTRLGGKGEMQRATVLPRQALNGVWDFRFTLTAAMWPHMATRPACNCACMSVRSVPITRASHGQLLEFSLLTPLSDSTVLGVHYLWQWTEWRHKNKSTSVHTQPNSTYYRTTCFDLSTVILRFITGL